MKGIGKKIITTRTIGMLLVITGIAIVLVAFGMRYYGETKQRNMMNDFEKSITNYKQEDSAESPESPESTRSQQDNVPKDKEPIEGLGTIGIIRIPKIDLKVAIGEGVDMNTLKYGVGHFPQTAMAGQKGNFCVAGHRSYTYSEYFNRLEEINKGDEIYVKTRKGEYKYIVYDKKVVEPSEYSVLDATQDATLTLITCTPIRAATHRLIIKARMQ
ncbi:MAG: class D sortase [Clostridiaceae bacterium]|nr:class D sortase [Clostridiaceae bacterium]